ncbi:MAG TPA: FdtA/QdtA family cupin domain-containing protein [Candidatus Polarisedimenticolia bacterium]|jgi:oxalate decarboxylase/phosphoglucose isomerase-like protein (cupin superfamily)|nr:FdtA/QdtA family cupin domain-containing protein [Candidatus Polarisedimenticolia bacterium]
MTAPSDNRDSQLPGGQLLPRLIALQRDASTAGDLIVMQAMADIPFAIRRVYFIHGIPEWAVRGGHAHRRCHEVVVAAEGAMTVTLEAQDGSQHRFRLAETTTGLYVPPLYWRTVSDYRPASLCLVLASEDYDPTEYLRDRDEFRRFGLPPDAHPVS